MIETLFLHSMLQVYKASKPLSSLMVDGALSLDLHVIQDHVVNYFSNIFNSVEGDACVDESLISKVIFTLVSHQDNDFLVVLPLDKEVKDVVFDLEANSAPSPDGFIGTFY